MRRAPLLVRARLHVVQQIVNRDHERRLGNQRPPEGVRHMDQVHLVRVDDLVHFKIVCEGRLGICGSGRKWKFCGNSPSCSKRAAAPTR